MLRDLLEIAVGYDESDPREVASAYEQITKNLAKKEGTSEERQWDNLFSQLRSSGVSPGQAGAENFVPSKPSELERWKSQIDALITSGNPVLQKNGLQMLHNYQQRATTVPKSEARSMAHKLATDLGLKPGTPEYIKFIREYALKPATSVNINQGAKPIPSSAVVKDEQGNRVNIPVGTTYEEAADQGYTFGQQPTSEEAQQAAAVQTSMSDLERLRDLVYAEGADVTGIEGTINQFRAGSGVMNNVVNSALEFLGQEMTPATAEAISTSMGLGVALLDAIRGAQVGPAEEILFKKQLPTAGQPEKVFRANMIRTQRTLYNLAVKKAKLRGTKIPPEAKDYLIFDYNGYQYDISNPGQVRRRKL